MPEGSIAKFGSLIRVHRKSLDGQTLVNIVKGTHTERETMRRSMPKLALQQSSNSNDARDQNKSIKWNESNSYRGRTNFIVNHISCRTLIPDVEGKICDTKRSEPFTRIKSAHF